MFARLFFLFRDMPVSLKKVIYLSSMQLLFLLVFKPGLALIIFILILIGVNMLLYFMEKRFAYKNLIRFLSLILLTILAGLFTSGYTQIKFNQGLLDFFAQFSGHFIPSRIIENQNWLLISITTAGFLFLLNEVNFIIRYFFEALSLIPKMNDEAGRELDEKEYNAGRVIGMLERILILFFVLVNQLGAIGFIIAAKGFTRFKELDKREFAEYVLIGTLLSSLFAIAVALLIKQLIKY